MLSLDTYTFGLSRQTGKMRFRKEGQPDVLVDRIWGQWNCLGADRNGNITAQCALDVRQDGRGQTAYVYHPEVTKSEELASPGRSCDTGRHDDHDNCHISTTNPFPQGRASHYRLCYAREIAVKSKDEPCWRLRDERTDELWFVSDYKGSMNVNWADGGTHIFHDGKVFVSDDLVANFVS